MQLQNDTNDLNDKKVIKGLIKQLKSNKNLLLFIIMNLVQVFHCHFNSNFFPLFLTTLLCNDTPTIICSFLIGLSFVAPHLNNVYLLTLGESYGVYRMVNLLFWFKLLLGVVMFIIGKTNAWFLAIFIVSNRIFTEGICKLLNLVITDLVDEDYVINNRSQPIAAIIFGTINFLSKPGQTFAPIIATALLSVFTGQDIFKTRTRININHTNVLNVENEDYKSNDFRNGIFNLLIVIPVVCSVIQLITWRLFSLHGTRLNRVKCIRLNLPCFQHV